MKLPAWFLCVCAVVASAILVTVQTSASEPAPVKLAAAKVSVPEGHVDYTRDVKPILAARCYGCHSARKHENELRLDAASLILKGGEGGAAVEPGKSGDSLLIEAVLGENMLRMPPEGEPLTADQIGKLKKWIDQGATAPKNETIPPDPSQHWSYLRPVRSAVPTVTEAEWAKNPVDAFLLAAQQKGGVKHADAAPKNILLRRLYIDLIGIPPTRAELHEFQGDNSPNAYERVVDRLLASPQYGERWGRHWMDVWRYSDWDGFGKEIRESQYHIWHWRDWIVDSLNADKGYDQMVREMIAGDELAPGDPDTVRATGFLARNWYKFNRNIWLDFTVEHTSKAFLATTVNCSRCHHHMYDPIEQPDYYSFRAIFEPHDVRIDPVGVQRDTTKDGIARVYDLNLKTPTYLYTRGNEKQPDKEHPLPPAVPSLFTKWAEFKVEPVKYPLEVYYPGMRPEVQKHMQTEADTAIATAEENLSKASLAVGVAQQKLEEYKKENLLPVEPFVRSAYDDLKWEVEQAQRALPIAEKQLVIALAAKRSLTARVVAERAKHTQPIPKNSGDLALAAGQLERELNLRKLELEILQAEQELAVARRDFAPGVPSKWRAVEVAEKKVPKSRTARDKAQSELHVPSAQYASLGPVYPTESSGRRTALARWITSPKNPLAARVAINHMWLRHFGSPLVASMFDFGKNGKKPTHPELLDWLAVELMEHGWSTKHIHRLMVTSQAYRMQSGGSPELAESKSRDPDNKLLWRMNPRRMEAEAVRDSALALGGQLDKTLHGPDIDQEEGLKNFRRSLYFRSAKEKKVLFLSIFDSPNVTDCYRRAETVVPQQALAMVNSPLTLEQSRRLAKSLSKEIGEADEPETATKFIRTAFEQILCRAPTTREESECQAFLKEITQEFKDQKTLTRFEGPVQTSVAPSETPHQRAREGLILVLLNHNDFVTVR